VCRPHLKHGPLHPYFIHLFVSRPRVFSIRTFFLPSYFQFKLSPCFVFSSSSLFYFLFCFYFRPCTITHCVSRRWVGHLTLYPYQVANNINKCMGLAACTFPMSKFVKGSHSNFFSNKNKLCCNCQVITHLNCKLWIM